MKNKDVVILGAGAAGLMCAIEAAKRRRSVTVIEKNIRPSGKILISGGGRCNFTNMNAHPSCYLSHNPHFCKSALARYTQWDFIDFMTKHNLTWQEKKKLGYGNFESEDSQGQLFCNEKSQAVIDALLKECRQYDVEIVLSARLFDLDDVIDQSYRFRLDIQQESELINYRCISLVIATGGSSIPKMGATDFALQMAKKFNVKYYPFKSALVPLVLFEKDKSKYFQNLEGVSLWVSITASHKVYGEKTFKENMLITHKGLSGPVILQISSFWDENHDAPLTIDLLPERNVYQLLVEHKNTHPNKKLSELLKPYWPTKWMQRWFDIETKDGPLQHLSDLQMREMSKKVHAFLLQPKTSEGLAKAEVVLGGVDCDELNQKTMQVKNKQGLYFIGEAVDVTGYLGGYNFQWAWSSGWCAGQAV